MYDELCWNLINVIGYLFDLLFKLMGGDGYFVDVDVFCGCVVFVYFGYMYCFDVCFEIFVWLMEVLVKFGLQVDDVCILFVFVDFVCDMLQVMQFYVVVFDVVYVCGLIGIDGQIELLVKCYCVVYQMEKCDLFGGYEVMYSLVVYIFDVIGCVCLFVIDCDLFDVIVVDVCWIIDIVFMI